MLAGGFHCRYEVTHNSGFHDVSENPGLAWEMRQGPRIVFRDNQNSGVRYLLVNTRRSLESV